MFYNDVKQDLPNLLFVKFSILHALEEANEYFANTDNRFPLGEGLPQVRFKLFHTFLNLGVKPYSLKSDNSGIGIFDVKIADGVTIGYHCVISNSDFKDRISFLSSNRVRFSYCCFVNRGITLTFNL